jgi:hypothetical protein
MPVVSPPKRAAPASPAQAVPPPPPLPTDGGDSSDLDDNSFDEAQFSHWTEYSKDGLVFYHNHETGESTSEHPVSRWRRRAWKRFEAKAGQQQTTAVSLLKQQLADACARRDAAKEKRQTLEAKAQDLRRKLQPS